MGGAGGEVGIQVEFAKVDQDRRIVSGWASVAKNADGSLPHDTQGDVIDTPDAIRAWEDAWLDYSLHARNGDLQHEFFKVSQLHELLVVTPKTAEQVAKAIGATLPDDGTQFVGAWVSYYLPETEKGNEAWDGVKSGLYKSFSIVGEGVRQEIKDAA